MACAVIGGVLVVPISVSGSSLALPALVDRFPSDGSGLPWVVNAFNLAFALSPVVWGLLIGRLGPRAVFGAGAAVMLAGAVTSALAGTLGVLVAGRAAAGTGAGALIAAGAALIDAQFTGSARERMFAAYGTAMGCGLALGPTCSGFLIDAAGWRAAFAVPVPFMAGALAVLAGTTPVRRPAADSTDRTTATPGSTGSALKALRTALRTRRMLGLMLLPVLQAAGFISMLTYLPLTFSAVYDMSSAAAGLLMLAMTLPLIVAPSLAGLALRRGVAGVGGLISVSLALMVVGDLTLCLLAPDFPALASAPALVLLGLSFGLPLGVLDNEVLKSAPPGATGPLIGVFNLVRLGSEALAVAATGIVLRALVTAEVGSTSRAAAITAGAPLDPEAYAHAFSRLTVALAGALAVAGTAVALLLRARSRPQNAAYVSGQLSENGPGNGSVTPEAFRTNSR